MTENNDKKINMKFAAITVGFLLMVTILMVLVFTNKNSHTADVSEYVTFSFTGVNGGGHLDYQIDKKGLYKQLAGNERNAVLLNKIDALVNGITVRASKSEMLSNGEEIMIKVIYDDEIAKQADCQLRCTDYIVKAGDLGDGSMVDIFSKVELVIAGISPKAYANVVNRWEEEYLKNVSFTIDKPADIRIGDVITVTCNITDSELITAGISIVSRTKQYKVDKINAYVQDSTQIQKELLQAVVAEAQETIDSETENLVFRMLYKASGDSAYLFQYNTEWVNTCELTNAVFLYKKEYAESTVQNYIYLFFKANISNGTSTENVYFSFEYPDSIMTTDGNFSMNHSDLTNRYICGMDLNDVYGRVVLSKESGYTITDITALVK